MKSIFILILFTNVLFFAHQYFFSTNKIYPHNDRQFALPEEDVTSPHGLLLLSEGSVAGEAVAKNTRQKAHLKQESDDAPQKNGSLCAMIGPYGQLLQAEYAVERLAALGVDVHVAPVEIKAGELFWVYLIPEISEREALNRLYELQGKSIESHVISKGELANGISFGRFSKHEDADVLAQKIKSLGYDAQIKIMPRIIQETWVVVADGFVEKIDDSVWRELMGMQKGLEKRLNYCLGVASE